jgi:ribosomal protein S18 acetylase RimI-like enzyme
MVDMNESRVGVRRATSEDIERIAPLFDSYRQFYGQAPALNSAREFLLERFERGESTILLAEDERGRAVGFAQLYPTFSSVSLARSFIMNDLYVAFEARRLGVARALLRSAVAFGKSQRAVRITLSTHVDNAAARALYVSAGWELQTDYQVYTARLVAPVDDPS